MINLKLDKKLFNEVYLPYITSYEHRYEVMYGSAGSGKSVFITQKLLIKALNKKRKILVIRKTQASQRESCWRLFLDVLVEWKILTYCKIRLSDYTIELPNGSIILFKGLDDPEKIKSIAGITDIWIEEATELNEIDFDQLNLRLRAKVPEQQIFLSFNPISKANWVYKRWFADDAKLNDDTFILKTTYKDNRFLPPEYIKSLEEMINTNPTYYRIYGKGEFCSLDKLVYTNWVKEEFDHTEIKGELIIGLDWGFVTDPTALIAGIVDEANKIIYIFKEYYETGLTNPQIAQIIKSLGFAKSDIRADSAEPKSIEELKQLGIQKIKPSVKGPDSVIHGIQKLQQYKLIVHPDCQETITELENYSWEKDKKSGEYINNKPVDSFNHILDALRYAMQKIWKNSKLKSINKSVLGL